MGHRVEKRLPAGGILDLFQLLRKVEIIPANDAVLDEQLGGFRQAGLRRPAANRRNLEGKSEYCLRWKVLKTVGESKAARSNALRILIRGMRGLLGRGSKPAILQGLPPACRTFYYKRSRGRWRTDGGEKVCPARVSRNG